MTYEKTHLLDKGIPIYTGPLIRGEATPKEESWSAIAKTLIQRGNKYGEFKDHANITQGLKTIFHETLGWAGLEAFQKEALEMIAHKIGRILNGDPNYHDSWHDIVGYAKLVADRLLPKEEEE